MIKSEEILHTIQRLRKELHAIPEVSGQERQTKAALMDFLKGHTTLELLSCGGGFYAAHRETAAKKPAIALRADYDALSMPDGSACHLCGHDGHAAALCGAALLAEGGQFDRNIYFLFQPAEETGAGAEGCCELFRRETVGEIYGAHNLPGLPLGQIVTRPGTFACASRGVILRFGGKPAHAAYPENGISPATAIGRLLCALPPLYEQSRYTGMTLCTVIGVQMGEKAFGAAAADAEVWLTLRAEHDIDLTSLHEEILHLSRTLAAEYGLTFSHQVQDVFPATENTPDCANKVLNVCGGTLLAQPMRWSEDFGHYMKYCPGAFFGIGAGEKHPPLHTECYEYPDVLLEPTMRAFLALMRA
ncbi:MAG: M20/M25/M40 family metallo-hydrolase [Clostridia bacterium]|nr:M20/M25/M40 family metallo-hydrolase [Clostridia bacterium]